MNKQTPLILTSVNTFDFNCRFNPNLIKSNPTPSFEVSYDQEVRDKYRLIFLSCLSFATDIMSYDLILEIVDDYLLDVLIDLDSEDAESTDN